MNINDIYIVTVDSTDNGDYQNNAYALLFDTFDAAYEYVKEDIEDTECNDDNRGKAKWYDKNTAQYRRDDVIVDWKIEKSSIKSKL